MSKKKPAPPARVGKAPQGPNDLVRRDKKGSSSLLLAEKALSLRLASGLSQAAFAAKAGVGYLTYQRLETATSNTTLDTADLVARAHGLDLAALLKRN